MKADPGRQFGRGLQGDDDRHDGRTRQRDGNDRAAPIRSDRMPPIGRAITAAMANPAVRVPASVRSKS